MKHCAKCKQAKPIEAFQRNQRSADGRDYYCKECRNSATRRYQAQHTVELNEDRRRRYHARHDQERARAHAYYHQHREQVRERNRRWQREHPNRVNASQRRRYAQHRDRHKAYVRRSYQHHRDDRLRRAREWAQADYDRGVVRTQRWRARQYGLTESFTLAEWKALCACYDERCVCCGEQRRLTVDHVVPLSKGGANTIANIQPLCHRCNNRK